MKTIFLNPNKIEQKWYLIDAEGETLGHLAVKAANILRGKNKPYYTPHQNVGDFVIIINSGKVAVTGQKRKNKLYYRHTGYPGGLYINNFDKMIATLLDEQLVFINQIGRVEKYIILLKEVIIERIPPDSVIEFFDEIPELIDILLTSQKEIYHISAKPA